MLKFPKDFVWGSSTSGPQTEGRVLGDGKGDNLWDYWYQVEPNRYYNGIGPDKTSTFYENWKKDIELLVETGHTAFRTSIQWSRIFPQGRGKVNPQGVAFYRQVFEAIKDKGIRLLVNLYHFDLPFALQEDGDGWENKATIKAQCLWFRPLQCDDRRHKVPDASNRSSPHRPSQSFAQYNVFFFV